MLYLILQAYVPVLVSRPPLSNCGMPKRLFTVRLQIRMYVLEYSTVSYHMYVCIYHLLTYLLGPSLPFAGSNRIPIVADPDLLQYKHFQFSFFLMGQHFQNYRLRFRALAPAPTSSSSSSSSQHPGRNIRIGPDMELVCICIEYIEEGMYSTYNLYSYSAGTYVLPTAYNGIQNPQLATHTYLQLHHLSLYPNFQLSNAPFLMLSSCRRQSKPRKVGPRCRNPGKKRGR